VSAEFDKWDGEFIIECACGEYETYLCDSWHEGLQMAKEDGWRVFKNGEVWTHQCTKCH